MCITLHTFSFTYLIFNEQDITVKLEQKIWFNSTCICSLKNVKCLKTFRSRQFTPYIRRKSKLFDKKKNLLKIQMDIGN